MAKGCDLLKIARRIRGLTQIEVADTYGVNLKTYQRWEKGIHPVSYDDLAALCEQVFVIPLPEVERAEHYAK
ncbi:helix-turn-helix domain-containing protein [Shewanella sp. VB17]|uniref:helix-turn-helix domain-containing protein n=1 Tax=Shewanella sp. VB17 TaxID=2739432 RepID=UPI0015643EAC|nr:helix-turn-helix transcriptional regulator [Shewanella sp. VB17]